MSDVGETLINIGPNETRKRLVVGLLMIAIGFVLAVVLSYSGARRAWSLLLFAPFWMGTLSLFQSHGRT